MSVSFHHSQQKITKIGNVINSQKFPPGIFDVADSREFPGIPEREFPAALYNINICEKSCRISVKR